MPAQRFSMLVILAIAVIATQGAAFADIGFIKVADTDTRVPGGFSTFTSFSAPSMRAGHVAFDATGGGMRGIYTTIGGLHAVADGSTVIPGDTETFWTFYGFSFDGASVAFTGYGPSGQIGIYTDVGGTLHTIADLTTPIPGGTGTFSNLGNPSIGAGAVAFQGSGSSGQRGIYTDLDGLSVVIDTTTPIPGGTGTFAAGDFLAFDGQYAAFRGLGSGGQRGIYSDAGGALHVVADVSTPVPGGEGRFGEFGATSTDSGLVAFFGAAIEQHGIYTSIGGLDVVADTNTAVPDGHGTFTSLRQPALSGHDVAFEGAFRDEFGELQDGIYAEYEGSLIKIIDSRDLLDGKSIVNTIISVEAFDDNLLAFGANFEDGSAGLYIAVIPEPTTLLLLAAASLTLLGGGRHARQDKSCQDDFPEWNQRATTANEPLGDRAPGKSS